MGLSVMKKKAEDDGLLRDGRSVLDMKTKARIGTQYSLLSGPLGTTVTVYDANPKEHHVSVPNKGTRIMSKEAVKQYVSNTGEGLDEMPLTELMRRSNIEKAQQEDVKKIQNK